MNNFGQKARFGFLVAYLGLLVGTSKYLTGAWIPSFDKHGFWFYSGAVALILGNQLITPFFTKPADAISYAVSALLAMLSVSTFAGVPLSQNEQILWWIFTSYIASVLIISIFGIATRAADKSTSQRISESAFVLTNMAGDPRFLFSSVFAFALAAFHRESLREFVVITLVWIVIVLVRPLEAITSAAVRLVRIWQGTPPSSYVGEVVAHESPRIALIRQAHLSSARFGDLLVVRTDDGTTGVAIALDHLGYADGRWLRALHVDVPAASQPGLVKLTFGLNPQAGAVARIDNPAPISPTLLDARWVERDRLIGLVSNETDITQLKVDTVRVDKALEEGQLLEVAIHGASVLYQVINGVTHDELLEQKNRRGYMRVEAKKIGTWDASASRFIQVRWAPQPNEAVFLVDRQSATPSKDAIGYVPRTPFAISIDTHALVTHNTAILGILGSGKSFLAIELIERMIADGIKVFCFDMTDQYATALGTLYDSVTDTTKIDAIKVVGPPGKTKCEQNVEEGGSVREFEAKVQDHVTDFLSEDCGRYVSIVNPCAFEVWRQDSKPFQGKASMASLTPTEITRVFTEAILEAAQSKGITAQARCCLVFEEAHSLIPEWNAVASEGDKTATNGTAKAILQGRKFGLGCVVITQRTANVTKSILNQCNTIFALRVFDATGVEFLKNYIGEDYARVLSTLEDRHAVVFGRASSCSNPILIRLNDRDTFINVFRSKPILGGDL